MPDSDSVHMAHGRSNEQRKVMQQIQEDGVDPFDWELLSKYHEKPVIRSTTLWILTANDYPYQGTAHHFLLIYRDRVRSFAEMEAAAWSELHEMLIWVENEFQLTHGALLMRFGEPSLSGASVDHLHIHIIVGGDESGGEKIKAAVGYIKK